MLELIGFIIVILLLRFVFRTTKFFIKMAIIIYVLFMVFKYWDYLQNTIWSQNG